jgi:hypothetical protein
LAFSHPSATYCRFVDQILDLHAGQDQIVGDPSRYESHGVATGADDLAERPRVVRTKEGVQNQAKRAVAPPVDKVVAAQQREPELLTSNDPVQVVDLWVEVFLPSPSVPPRPEIRSDL